MVFRVRVFIVTLLAFQFNVVGSATAAGAVVFYIPLLLAALVAVAVALRLIRFLTLGFTARGAAGVPAVIALILTNFVAAVALGHDERAPHEIGGGLNWRSHGQSQCCQPKNSAIPCIHPDPHFRTERSLASTLRILVGKSKCT